MRMVLAMEGLEGPNTQVQAERFMAVTGHHLEVMMVTCHQLGFAGEVAETSFLRQRKTCIVLAREACEGPNTPDQARRLIARRDRLCCLRVLGRQKVTPNDVVGNSSRAKLQRVSSGDRRTPVLLQTVNQSVEMRSAWEFFATAQMFIIHIFYTVLPFSVVVTASVIHRILA